MVQMGGVNVESEASGRLEEGTKKCRRVRASGKGNQDCRALRPGPQSLKKAVDGGLDTHLEKMVAVKGLEPPT